MKPVEELVGDNRGIVRQIINRDVHCGSDYLTAARAVFRKWNRETRKTVPKELRRGLVKCILDTHRENKRLYFDVLRGNIGSGD